MTRNDGQKEDNSHVKCKGPEVARSAVSDLKQEADFGLLPFVIKTFQTLESMGDVDAILRGLGTQPNFGLSNMLGRAPSHAAGPPDSTSQDFCESHAADSDLPKSNIMVTSSAGVPQGLQSTASLAGGSGVSLPTAFQPSEDAYRTSLEDRKRNFGQNIVPQRPSKNLLQFMWLALKDKALVRWMNLLIPMFETNDSLP
jgi:Ca2+-transporting ATPase